MIVENVVAQAVTRWQDGLLTPQSSSTQRSRSARIAQTNRTSLRFKKNSLFPLFLAGAKKLDLHRDLPFILPHRNMRAGLDTHFADMQDSRVAPLSLFSRQQSRRAIFSKRTDVNQAVFCTGLTYVYTWCKRCLGNIKTCRMYIEHRPRLCVRLCERCVTARVLLRVLRASCQSRVVRLSVCLFGNPFHARSILRSNPYTPNLVHLQITGCD
ncbi:hypothetical protein J6590_027989 [Homalodisca vitripennis]|nr:hypothetical protein J6590_027989 [Homalodisca vitripennis]